MLSLFPQLFTYSELAPFILRLAAGLICLGLAYPKLKKPIERLNFFIGLAEFCAAILLIAGFLTQLAAGLIILALMVEIFKPGLKDYKFMILLIIILVALMFLGPGFFSIDLPL